MESARQSKIRLGFPAKRVNRPVSCCMERAPNLVMDDVAQRSDADPQVHTFSKIETRSLIHCFNSSTMASSMPSHLEESLFKRQKARRLKQSSSPSFSTSSTKSIPIHLNHEDIQEEWEIREQEWIAEERDYIMFHRIVKGMIARQGPASASSNASYQSETEKSIANIMRTRYKKMDSETKKDQDSLGAYDDETELVNNGRRDLPRAGTTESDRPPETIFIMDM